MFKVKEIAGQLIKSGRFKEAISHVNYELRQAVDHGVIHVDELFPLMYGWASILLNPSDYDEVQRVGDMFINLATRIPGFLQPVDEEEYKKNIEKSYGPR